VCRHEIETKNTNKSKKGGPRPPRVLPVVFLSPRSHSTSVSSRESTCRCHARGKVSSQTCQHMFISLWAVTMNDPMVIIHCYMDSRRLYELVDVKNILVCALEVNILNVHIFARGEILGFTQD